MAVSKRTGTNSIERAILLLKEIATHGSFGWGLGELAERCGLDRGTTHRILACLVRERMVQQNKSNRQYLPGPLIFELGLAIPAYLKFQAACRPVVARLAKRFDAACVFYLRSGTDWVCAVRAGPAVYGGTILEEGTRRPLLSSVGGAAILIALPSKEAEQIVRKNKWQMRQRDEASIKLLENMLRRSRRLGYAFNKSEVSKAVHSFGVPVRYADDQVFAALAVGGRSKDFPASRTQDVISALQSEAKKIERAARQALPV